MSLELETARAMEPPLFGRNGYRSPELLDLMITFPVAMAFT